MIRRVGGKRNLQICDSKERKIHNAAEIRNLFVWSVPKTAKSDLAEDNIMGYLLHARTIGPQSC
jgi:hypothetical protein